MYYKKYIPSNHLRKYVECFYIWEGLPLEPLEIESPPSALGAIVFNFKEPYHVSNDKYTFHKVPKNFVCGQEIKNYTLHIKGEIGLSGIVLRPASLYRILGMPMYGFSNERIPFEQLFCGKGLIDSVLMEQNHEQRINLLEAFITDALDQNNYGTPEITFAANYIYESHGHCKLPELIQSVYMSRRTFERKFLEEVGISPKAYARIRRFGYTCSIMAGDRESDMTEALHKGGYYDQSHFIKDFKYFVGRTPGQYLKDNVELANYVDAFQIIEKKLILGRENPVWTE